ncbi:MAG: FecR domain-containing protein [Elusimicrobia bacterium]|nr:FecR domain-containing protein [Elusimicrobiota bacterium]
MNYIKKIVLLAVAGLVFSASVSHAAILESFEGDIKYQSGSDGEWVPAELNQSLSDGDSLATFENSWAEVLFSAGHSVRIGEGSTFHMKDTSDDIMLDILRGQILSRVSKMPEGRKFEVASPQSVTAVRGTVFSVEISPELAETVVRVFEGEVVSRELLSGAEVTIPTGFYSRVRPNSPPTAPAELSQLESGSGDMSDATLDSSDPAEEDADAEEAPESEPVPEETREMARADLRNEIRGAVADIKVELQTTQDTIQQKKDADSVTGRAMRDIHGNLVRVEQHLIRPDNKTLQFINITKRDNYKYAGIMGVSPSGSRLDTIETKIVFSKDLPSKFSDWPKFIQDNEDDDTFHPKAMELKISNQKDLIRVASEWDSADEDFADPEVSFISGREGVTKGEWIVDADPEDDFNQGEMAGDDDGSSKGWAITPKLRLYRPGSPNDALDDVRVGLEGWLINNDGKLVDINSLSEGNPFDTIKKIGAEIAAVVRYGFDENYVLNDENVDSDLPAIKKEALQGFVAAKDFFSNNFDIVITPDFLYNIIEEMASNINFDDLGEEED